MKRTLIKTWAHTYLGKLRILYFQCLTLNLTFERTPDFTRTHTAWTQCRIVWKFHHFIIKEHPCLQFPQMTISIWGALDVWKWKTIRLSKVLIIWLGLNSLRKSPKLFDVAKWFQKKIFSNFMAFSQYMNFEVDTAQDFLIKLGIKPRMHYASMGNKHIMSLSDLPKLWTEPTKIGHIFRKQSKVHIFWEGHKFFVKSPPFFDWH